GSRGGQLLQIGGGVLDKRNFDAGMAAREGGKHERQNMRSGDRECAENELSFSQIRDVVHLVPKLLDEIEHHLRLPDEYFSGMRRFDCVRRAMEKRNAELPLELGELLA